MQILNFKRGYICHALTLPVYINELHCSFLKQANTQPKATQQIINPANMTE
ncbi:hypothetical protein FORC76_1051 [Vibrio cholerae]|nr:hypothetical protein VCHC55A1_2035 [Vibrio cholerae HC-55A1]QAV04548.1 hypothetical protein FORC76_1051 [Vibrio cholerae]